MAFAYSTVVFSTFSGKDVSYAYSTGHLVITTKTVSRLDLLNENGRVLQHGEICTSVPAANIFLYISACLSYCLFSTWCNVLYFASSEQTSRKRCSLWHPNSAP